VAVARLRRGSKSATPIETGRRGVAGALALPDFRRWFLVQIFSASGVTTQSIGQAWLVVKLGGNGVQLGLLAAAIFLPVLLGGAAGGALVDRVERRKLLLITQSLFLCIGVALALVTGTGVVSMWMLYVCALASGLVTTVDGPARQVYVIDLVGRANLASAIGLYEVVLNAARVVGPGIGGALLAKTGVAACFWFNAVAFVPAVVVLLMQRRRPAVAVLGPATQVSIRAGIRYALTQPAIRSCLIMATAVGMLFNLSVTLPLLVTRVFHLGGGGFGVMNAIFGAGSLLGALVAARGAAGPTGPRLRILALLTGCAIVAAAVAPGPVTFSIGLAVAGFLTIWLVAAANTLAQMRSEPDLRGRVMGVWSMALPGMNPLTGLLTGLIADTFGPRAGFGLAGIAFLLAVPITWSALADRIRAD
jgi:MFS family permease